MDNENQKPRLTIVLGKHALKYIEKNDMTRSLLNRNNKYLKNFLLYLRRKGISACIALTDKKDEYSIPFYMRFLADKIIVTYSTDIYPHWKYRVYKDRTQCR